jgi:prophage antirepressor-like protein
MFNFPSFDVNGSVCPIEFDNHMYAGSIAKVEMFSNIEFGDIRTTFINGRPYFCAIDIMNALGISDKNINRNIDNAVQDIIEGTSMSVPEYGTKSYTPPQIEVGYPCDIVPPNELYFTVNIEVQHTGNQYCSIINQIVPIKFISKPILYFFIFRSNAPSARRFKGWMSNVILPYLEELGRQNAVAVLQSAVQKQQEEKINQIYDKVNSINDTVNKVDNGCNRAFHYTNDNIDDLRARVDEIGWNSYNNLQMNSTMYKNSSNMMNNTLRLMNNTQNIMNSQVDLATGLNTIFGGNIE